MCFLSRGADKPTAEGIQIDLRKGVLLCVRVRGEVDKAVLHMLSGRLGEGRSMKREWSELGWCGFGKARVHGCKIKGGRRVRLLEYGLGSKMEGWRKNWSRRVGSRERIGVYTRFGNCRKCTGALMVGYVGSAEERKWGRGEEMGLMKRGLLSVPIHELC